MAASFEHHDADAKRNPLIPVGLTVLAILAIPLGMYSFGPEGPIKKNHVVFSTGQHRAHFAAMSPPAFPFLLSKDKLGEIARLRRQPGERERVAGYEPGFSLAVNCWRNLASLGAMR